jgi:hypothetical protein
MSTRPESDAAVTLARGGLVGLAAWLLGYLVTFLFHAGSIREAFATDVVEFLAGDPVTWKLVGWLYFNAHFVATSIPGLFGDSTTNVLSGAEDVTLLALYVLPPVVLLAAGAAVARGVSDPTEGAKTGAAVALGYLVASAVGAFLVRISVADAVAGPALVTAILLAGAVYPLVFGALGGVVPAVLSGRQ